MLRVDSKAVASRMTGTLQSVFNLASSSLPMGTSFLHEEAALSTVVEWVLRAEFLVEASM